MRTPRVSALALAVVLPTLGCEPGSGGPAAPDPCVTTLVASVRSSCVETDGSADVPVSPPPAPRVLLDAPEPPVTPARVEPSVSSRRERRAGTSAERTGGLRH